MGIVKEAIKILMAGGWTKADATAFAAAEIQPHLEDKASSTVNLPRQAAENGGDDVTFTGREAEQDVRREAHKLMRLDPSLSFSEAMVAACRIDPALYRRFDEQQRARALAGEASEHVRRPVEPDAAATRPDLDDMHKEMQQAAEAAGMSLTEWATRTADGRLAYEVYDQMGKRGISRTAAERTVGQ